MTNPYEELARQRKASRLAYQLRAKGMTRGNLPLTDIDRLVALKAAGYSAASEKTWDLVADLLPVSLPPELTDDEVRALFERL